jgi:transaldolase
VPATKEGLPAIKALLEDGINVNVTLIFSTERYAEVAEAHISALEARHAQGKPVSGIASVASFFVSRVDALCEKKFEEAVKAGKAKETDKGEFFGKIGIANSRCAYQKFKEIFGSPRFSKLVKAGAQAQRPLWASTGTKNPAFSPVLYVEALAGKDTVNTVPPDTLKAILKGVALSGGIESGAADAAKLVARMAGLGVNLSSVLEELEVAGVSLFADSYRELVESIEKKRGKV